MGKKLPWEDPDWDIFEEDDKPCIDPDWDPIFDEEDDYDDYDDSEEYAVPLEEDDGDALASAGFGTDEDYGGDMI